MSYISNILLILLMIFALVIFRTRLPFSNIFTTPSVDEQDDKNNVENPGPYSISHHHTKDTVQIHPKPQLNPQKSSPRVRGKDSRRGEDIRRDSQRGKAVYPCRNENASMSLFPYRSSFTGHRPRILSSEFMRHLDSGNQSLYFGIKLNTTLTKHKIADAIKIWLQTLPEKVQANYAEWQANITQKREQFVESVKVNLSGPANQLYDKIRSIVDDENLTRSDTTRRIMEFILDSRIKPWLELNRALGKALCHCLNMSPREEQEQEAANEELSEEEKNLNLYISILVMQEFKYARKAVNAESGGVPLLDETLMESLFVFRTALGLNPVE